MDAPFHSLSYPFTCIVFDIELQGNAVYVFTTTAELPIGIRYLKVSAGNKGVRLVYGASDRDQRAEKRPHEENPASTASKFIILTRVPLHFVFLYPRTCLIP